MGLAEEFAKIATGSPPPAAETARLRADGVAELDKSFREFADLMSRSGLPARQLGLGRLVPQTRHVPGAGMSRRDWSYQAQVWTTEPLEGSRGWVLGDSTPALRDNEPYDDLPKWFMPERVVVTTEGLVAWTVHREGRDPAELSAFDPGMYLQNPPVSISDAPRFDVAVGQETAVSVEIKANELSHQGFQIWLRPREPIEGPRRRGEDRTVSHTQWLFQAYQQAIGQNP